MKSVLYIMPIIILIYSAIQLITEAIELWMDPINYILDLVNFLEIALYLSTFTFVTAYLYGETCEHKIGSVHVNSGACAIMLAYCNLLFYLKRFPFIGLIVLMFIEVLKTVISVIVIFAAIIFGFAMAFYFLSDSLSDSDFYSTKSSILKVVRMTIGDGSISKKTKGQNNSSGDMTDYMYLFFALLLPIVMVNLMVSVSIIVRSLSVLFFID